MPHKNNSKGTAKKSERKKFSQTQSRGGKKETSSGIDRINRRKKTGKLHLSLPERLRHGKYHPQQSAVGELQAAKVALRRGGSKEIRCGATG